MQTVFLGNLTCTGEILSSSAIFCRLGLGFTLEQLYQVSRAAQIRSSSCICCSFFQLTFVNIGFKVMFFVVVFAHNRC